ncbi:MAG: AEC family transporter, partial [Armatimonadetes bacterium]|nr:AEC family transporter [Armatimonadota bacterium]
MSIELRAAETLVVILSGLTLGWLSKRRGLSAEKAPAITRTTLIYLEPLPNLLALWGLRAGDTKAFYLPLLGAALIVLMWPVGHLIGRLQRMENADLGAFVAASMFSNVGFTFGAFLCYALLGERGVALGTLYTASFMPMLFTVGLFAAGRYSSETTRPAWELLKDTARKPESRNPIAGILVGLALYAAGVERPAAAGTAVNVLVPLTTFIYLFAIGLSMRPRTMLGHWRPATVLCAVKFLISPAVGLALGVAAGIHRDATSDLLPVLFIQSAAPAGIMS